MSTNFNVEKTLIDAIKKAITEQLEQEFDLKKEELLKKLENSKNRIIASTCLQIMRYVSMEKRVDDFVITVKEIKDK
jgi:hypothetical protein